MMEYYIIARVNIIEKVSNFSMIYQEQGGQTGSRVDVMHYVDAQNYFT